MCACLPRFLIGRRLDVCYPYAIPPSSGAGAQDPLVHSRPQGQTHDLRSLSSSARAQTLAPLTSSGARKHLARRPYATLLFPLLRRDPLGLLRSGHSTALIDNDWGDSILAPMYHAFSDIPAILLEIQVFCQLYVPQLDGR